MKFFKDSKNWRNELAVIGLSIGTVLFFLNFLWLGFPDGVRYITLALGYGLHTFWFDLL